MTKTKSHEYRMVYIEAQDKKTQVRDKKNELQAIWFDWYSIGTCDFRSIESRILANIKRPYLIRLKAKSQALFSSI